MCFVHPDRKEKMEQGFSLLGEKNIPGLNKNRILSLLKENSHTTRELSLKLNLNYFCVKGHLKRLYKLGNVDKIKGRGPIPNKWFI